MLRWRTNRGAFLQPHDADYVAGGEKANMQKFRFQSRYVKSRFLNPETNSLGISYLFTWHPVF